MTEVKELLARALDDERVPRPSAVVVAGPDLDRGRARLRRRNRLRVAVGAGVLSLSLGAASVLTLLPQGGSRPVAQAPAVPMKGVALVAYTGEQPKAFRVAEIPQGWTVETSDSMALVVRPPWDDQGEPDGFQWIGDLLVTIEQPDADDPRRGGFDLDTISAMRKVAVNGRPGLYLVSSFSAEQANAPAPTKCWRLDPAVATGQATPAEPDGLPFVVEARCGRFEPLPEPITVPPTQSLVFAYPGGYLLRVQAPVSLGWDQAALIRFAEGIEVSDAAEPKATDLVWR